MVFLTGGIGIAVYLGLLIFFGATIFAIASALLLAFLTLRERDDMDTIIGLIWAVGMAIGIIFIDLSKGYSVANYDVKLKSIIAISPPIDLIECANYIDNGFKSAKDYYSKSSSNQYLKKIKIPTLIIHSLDEISSYIKLEIYPNGGHVGFISGTLFKPVYWLEDRVVRYFGSLLN